MEPGTEVYFFLNPAIDKSLLGKLLVDTFSPDKMVQFDDDFGGRHKIFGRFYLERIGPEPGHVEHFCLMLADCETLPELAFNPPGYSRSEEAAPFGYHFARRLFLALDSESCWGTARADEVLPFDMEDPCMGRIFKFTRSGPQKLVRPYEENRPIRHHTIGELKSDMEDDPETGERRWVMHREGTLNGDSRAITPLQ